MCDTHLPGGKECNRLSELLEMGQGRKIIRKSSSSD